MDVDVMEEDEDAEHEDDPMMDEDVFADPQASLPTGSHEAITTDKRDDAGQEANQNEGVNEHGSVELVNGAASEAGPENEGRGDEEEEENDEQAAASVEDVRNVSDERSNSSEEGDSSNGASDAAPEWEEESNDRDDDDVAAVNSGLCIFCRADEEHDPGEDFEEYLACSVCGDNSHRQCARDFKALETDDVDAPNWRCPTCVENALQPESKQEKTTRRRAAAHKLTQDLLPGQRGGPRPGSHSVFNQLIVNSDPLDGSRLLRKRRPSLDGEDEPSRSPNKKARESVEAADSDFESLAPADEYVEPVQDSVEVVAHNLKLTLGTRPSERRPARSRAPKKADKAAVKVLEKNAYKLLLRFRVESTILSKIVAPEPKRKKKRSTHPRRSTPARPLTPAPPALPPTSLHPYPTPFATSFATPFYAFHERENDELKSKPYNGILSEAEADTSKTLPLAADREAFNKAKQKIEEAWNRKAAENRGMAGQSSQKLAGPASKIQCISFGGYEIDTWYAAPYPEEYSRNRVLYICEFCLKYMGSEYVAWRHKLKCPAKHPPGDEIYREGAVSVFEVDGRKNPVYCQNLCLLAKLFLGSKTLYYDVEPFLFYVMTAYDELGCRFVGYFSKEKRPSSSNNVSCILTLPIHQRKGYGNLLIDFSYLLTRVEKKTGSPEKPLSDMGLVSYRNYWRLVLCYQLRDQRDALSIADLSRRTGMTADDVVSGLEGLRALVRDPVTGTYAFRLDYDYFRDYIAKWEAKQYVRLNPDGLIWTPYIMGRAHLAHLEHGPPLATIAPRELEDADLLGARPRAEEGVQLEMMRDAPHHRSGDPATNGVKAHPAISPSIEPDPDRAHSFSPHHHHHHHHHHHPLGPANPPPGPPLTPLLGFASHLSGLSDSSTHADHRQEQHHHHHPTPKPAATSTPTMPAIPPTRFEIFPPLPGTATGRRKPGRPFGSTRKRVGTPASASPLSLSRRETQLWKGSSSLGLDEGSSRLPPPFPAPPPPPPPPVPQEQPGPHGRLDPVVVGDPEDGAHALASQQGAATMPDMDVDPGSNGLVELVNGQPAHGNGDGDEIGNGNGNGFTNGNGHGNGTGNGCGTASGDGSGSPSQGQPFSDMADPEGLPVGTPVVANDDGRGGIEREGGAEGGDEPDTGL
ncbi:MAG: hypothetical protein M1826_005633 [Phylliscum demangeonii]|nr:MAG: hypothetical protein M1826_005633 [Phylliscum demangeonii]